MTIIDSQHQAKMCKRSPQPHVNFSTLATSATQTGHSLQCVVWGGVKNTV